MEPTEAERNGGDSGGASSVDAIRRRNLNPNWSQLQKILKTSQKPFRQPSSSLGKRKDRSYEKPEAPSLPTATLLLTPTSADCSLTKELAMDCEMVGVGTDGTKSALGRIALVNAFGNVVYDEFVRPLDFVVDFRTSISGIRPKNLRKAKDFFTVQKEVAGLIKESILVGHALRNDLKVLFLTHPKKDRRDTSEYPPFRREGKRASLRHLASQILGVKIQKNEHCPVEDARAAMAIYQKHKINWERSMKARSKTVKINGQVGKKS